MSRADAPVVQAEAPVVRVAALLRTFPTLSEIFVYRELAALRSQGLPLHVAVVRRKPARTEAAFQRQCETLLGGPVLEVPRAPLYLPMLGATLRLLRARSHQTWKALRWGLEHQPLKDVLKGLWLAEHFWREGTAVLHVHFAGEAAELAEIVRLAVDIPYVVTLHARDLFVPRPSLPRVLKQAAALVAISAYNQRWLLAHHGPTIAAKSQVIHLGVPEISDPQDAPLPRPTGLRLLTVARLVEKKGHRLLLNVLARLRARGHRLHLTLVGDGPERSRLEAQVAALGLRDEVRFCGGLPQAELTRIYEAGVDLFVLPARVASDGDQDGIPVALMEAMSRGVLGVSTAVSGIPELLQDGVNGFLARAPGQSAASASARETPATSPPVIPDATLESSLEEALERALRLLKEDEAKAADMRLSAQQTIRTRFCGPAQATKVKALLEKITSSPDGHGL